MTISRMLAAMLATAALIVPVTAAAKPMDPIVDMHQSTAIAAAHEQAKQDLRAPDRRDPAPAPQLDRVGPPTWPANPQPLTPPTQSVAVASDDDGIDWATIGIGVGLSVVAVCAIGALSLRLRRRERVAT